jgi:histone H3/H4
MEQKTLVIRTKIKELANDCSVSKDFPQALDTLVEQAITKAVSRAKQNGRTTIMPRDL